MPGAVLIQQVTGRDITLLQLVASRHAAYCARHGLAYWPVVGAVQFSREPQWNQICLIRHALEQGFETVLWVAAGALLVRSEQDVRLALEPGGGPLALAGHDPSGAEPDLWHCGVLMMRNTPDVRAFFDALWRAGAVDERPVPVVELLAQYPGLMQRLPARWYASEPFAAADIPVVKAWVDLGPGAAVSIYDELKSLGALDGPTRAAAQSFVHGDNCVERAQEFRAKIPACPGSLEGRGIVICGGGAYFPSVWVNVRQLRRLGCTLPIQVWHLGAEEMDSHMRELLRPLGVECVDALAVRERHPARILNGWELKPYALLHSPFRQALLLDADNVAVLNPGFLFDAPEFTGAGAVFWPDYERMVASREAWRVFDVPYRDEPEFETGQILIDKSRCWQALNLAMWYNEHSDFFYRHVWGDKDTFRFAWHKTGQRFAMPPFPIHPLEDTMCQHDFSGRRLFQHRNGHKWKIRHPNKRIAGFLCEEECLADVERLKALWSGRVQRA